MIAGKADTSRFAKALQQRAEDLAQAGAKMRRPAATPSLDTRWRDARYLWPFFAAE